MLLCIGRLGGHRFNTPEDIDGSGLTTGTDQAKVLQSVLQNTLEQTVLAITLHLIWAVVMPVTWIPGILAAAILFFIGRLFFIRGYAGGAPARAGFCVDILSINGHVPDHHCNISAGSGEIRK